MLWIQFVIIILIFQIRNWFGSVSLALWWQFLPAHITITTSSTNNPYQTDCFCAGRILFPTDACNVYILVWCVFQGVSICCISLICCLWLSEEVNRTNKIYILTIMKFRAQEQWGGWGGCVGGDVKVDIPIPKDFSWTDPVVSHKPQIQQPYQARLPSSYQHTTWAIGTSVFLKWTFYFQNT